MCQQTCVLTVDGAFESAFFTCSTVVIEPPLDLPLLLLLLLLAREGRAGIALTTGAFGAECKNKCVGRSMDDHESRRMQSISWKW
jgi:hypothetical protein